MQAAFSTLQDDLQGLRDTRLPQTEAGLDLLQNAIVTVQEELGGLREQRLQQTESGLAALQAALEGVQSELEVVRDGRLPRAEADLDRIQTTLAAVQHEVETVRDVRLPQSEADLGTLHQALTQVQRLAEELRDGRLPALAARTDALLETIHEELTEVAGLVERLAGKEPLHVSLDPVVEASVPEAIRRSSLRLIDDFRGDTAEIAERVRAYVELLGENQPVLELGPGRGELLEALRNAGVDAKGVDSDPAMVAACRRRGLAVSQGDALAHLQATPDATLGAVVAIHVLEHMPAANWMSVIEGAARSLKPGGTLIVECPNPETLRVGGGLFWVDPTHRSPVHPDAVVFAARALGLEVVTTRFMRPFPPDQALARAGQPEAVHELALRLDAWLSGPRDFVVIARKPAAEKRPPGKRRGGKKAPPPLDRAGDRKRGRNKSGSG
jgi:SAM-dependent methyltransferase